MTRSAQVLEALAAPRASNGKPDGESVGWPGGSGDQGCAHETEALCLAGPDLRRLPGASGPGSTSRVLRSRRTPPRRRAAGSTRSWRSTSPEVRLTSRPRLVTSRPRAWSTCPSRERGSGVHPTNPKSGHRCPACWSSRSFTSSVLRGHSYLGYKDLQVPGIVFDHKSTSDLKWQKTEEELRKDIQATLYAVDYFREHPDENEVELRWVYYQTKNTRKSAVTRARVNQTETWNRFFEIEQIAEQMHVASTKRALDLPPTINHCSAYGGCPHQGRCNLSPFDKDEVLRGTEQAHEPTEEPRRTVLPRLRRQQQLLLRHPQQHPERSGQVAGSPA